jgi:hypothetical protein
VAILNASRGHSKKRGCYRLTPSGSQFALCTNDPCPHRPMLPCSCCY